MTAPEKPLSLSHREQSPALPFQEYYPNSGTSTSPLAPVADTTKPQCESAGHSKEATNWEEALSTQAFRFQRSDYAQSYDNVISNQQRPRLQISSRFNTNLPLRRKPVAAKGTQGKRKDQTGDDKSSFQRSGSCIRFGFVHEVYRPSAVHKRYRL